MSKVSSEKNPKAKDPSNWAEEKVIQVNRILELYSMNMRQF